eukprot:gene18568-25077_t
MLKKGKETYKKAKSSAKRQITHQIANLPSLENPPDKGECRRIALWAFWTLNMLLNVIYMGMSFATCSRLVKNFDDLQLTIQNHTWRAPIAAAALGATMVLVFNVISCIVLVRKSINRSGPGFGYGFIMAWTFVMFFYCLLCGLVLDAFSSTVQSDLESQTSWSGYYTEIYSGTVIFAYICSGMFIVFFLLLVVFQGGITKSMGMYDATTDEKRKLELAAVARYALENNMPANHQAVNI